MTQSESTAANPGRRSSRRWLQFSLRGFLVVMTIGCLWLGWKVEKARRRGRAIDALIVAGAKVLCDASPDSGQNEWKSLTPEPPGNHFWLDWEDAPVSIHLPMPLDAIIGSTLSSIHGTRGIEIGAETTDSQLQYLESTDARLIFIPQAPHVTEASKEELRRRFPNTVFDIPPHYPETMEDIDRH